MFESIDAGRPRDDKQRINAEAHCVARDIVNIVACEGAERVEKHRLFGKWRSRLTMAGFTKCWMSSAVSSAVKDVLKEYNANYWVGEKAGALYLGWKDRDLVTCGSEEEEEVLVCSSSSLFRQKSSFLGLKLKSRIIQQPEYDRRSKGFLKSRISGESSESNKDDPFLEDDLPEEYKKMKLSKGAVVQFVSLILIIAALAYISFYFATFTQIN
ncbi:hypothetical protein LguiB_008776 [Lonicera macranthoides]